MNISKLKIEWTQNGCKEEFIEWLAKRHANRKQFNLAYTSSAKTWWQQNSDRLGSDLTWDAFCEIWLAALNNEELLDEN